MLLQRMRGALKACYNKSGRLLLFNLLQACHLLTTFCPAALGSRNGSSYHSSSSSSSSRLATLTGSSLLYSLS
jgi:hypothetical protein